MAVRKPVSSSPPLREEPKRLKQADGCELAFGWRFRARAPERGANHAKQSGRFLGDFIAGEEQGFAQPSLEEFNMSPRIRARVPLAIASFTLGLVLSACGDDDLTGPGNQDVVGQWSYVITDAVGGGFTCDVTGITLTFTRSGETMEGTILAVGTDNLICVGSGGTQSTDFNGEGELEGVTVNGNIVAFTIPSLHGDWDSTGTLNGDSMDGNVTIRQRFGETTVVLNGTWEAIRN
jgi:hypothetical protein